jgi:hypothetical protein
MHVKKKEAEEKRMDGAHCSWEYNRTKKCGWIRKLEDSTL